MKTLIVLGLLVSGSASADANCVRASFPGLRSEWVEQVHDALMVHELRGLEAGQSLCVVDLEVTNESAPYERCSGFGIQVVSCKKFRGKLIQGKVKYCRYTYPNVTGSSYCAFDVRSFEPREGGW